MLAIRPERPTDYSAIADIHVQAFGYRADEAVIVGLLRQRQSFTPDLSLVAIQDERIVGHALFTPITMRLLRQDVRAVLLAPIAVLPTQQRQGIGLQLIQAGHQRAAALGFDIAILLGHPNYYSRFGYETYAFGVSAVTVQTHNLAYSPLEIAAPVPADMPTLLDIWHGEEDMVNFTIEPEAHLYDWVGMHKSVTARVYRHHGEIVGYSRQVGSSVRMFIARHHQAAHAMAKVLANADGEVTLPLHPSSASTVAFNPRPQVDVWAAGMATNLGTGSLLLEYFSYLRTDALMAGRPIWPTAFDLA